MSFLLSLIVILFSFSTINSDQKLIFVMTHFRHGARAPQNFYDQEKYLDYVKEHWDIPGELTGVGQRMHYLLGIRNRLRYVEKEKFLSEKFDPHEILIYSSPFNRTIVSVSSQLQGLYPQYAKQGEYITEEQEEFSKPQVDVDCDTINEEIQKLNLSALPNNMIIAPVRMINNNERKIILYDIEPCTLVRDEIKTKHSKKIESLVNINKSFKEKYAEKLKKLYGKEENLDLWFMDNFCDAFISAYTHKREMKELLDAGFEKEDLLDYCFEFQKLNFRDWISGDDKHVLAHLEVSKIMKEFIHYMKQRINADINGEKYLEKKYEDYSRPKMLMVSGHDSTISCHEIFLMDVFGDNIIENYVYPKFASQIAFEITTNDDGKTGKTFNDYFVNYYFNDELIFNKTVQEFIDKVSPHIWSDKKINDFCGFVDEDGDDDSDRTILILFIVLTGIFGLLSTILIILLIKNKVQSNSLNNNTLLANSQ